MYAVTLPDIRSSKAFMALVLGLMLLSTMAFSIPGQTPPAKLSLADVIVALRSQKVTLVERNKILTEAVLVRGITFALTPDIEKELTSTGADKTLVNAIKSKSSTVKVSVVSANDTAAPEYLAHMQRADADFARDDIDAALIEYSKAIELQPSLSSAYFSRGRIFLTKEFFDQAITDFSKVVELEPKNAAAYSFRAKAWEKKGVTELAVNDYNKVLGIKPDDAVAMASLDRIHAAEAKLKPQPALIPTSQSAPTTQTTEANAKSTTNGTAAEETPSGTALTPPKSAAGPEFVEVGALLAANTVRLAKPAYPSFALRANVTGRVTVQVIIDEDGNVISAKATDGHQLLRHSSEDAARRSKFKPAFYEGKPVKVTGVITYNYSTEGKKED